MQEVKTIVVLGAGFGGLTAVLKLAKIIKRKGLAKMCRIILVNKTSYQVYTPALYEIASIPKGEANAICLKTSICIDLEEVASRNGFQVVGGEIKSADQARKIVVLASGEKVAFDYLVVALGAETNYYNITGLKEHALPLKTFEDAIRLRNKIEEIVISGVSPIHIVIGGAGATGVELSAEFNNFLRYLKERLLSNAKIYNTDIILVDAAPDILPGFTPWLVAKAKNRLGRLGVKILTGRVIAGVDERAVTFRDGSEIAYHILVWAGGVTPVAVLKNLGLPLAPKGQVVVNEYLEAAPRVWAIGDNTDFVNPESGKPLPGNVPVAEQQALVAAKNIIAEITGARKKIFRPMSKYPYILAVGRKYAIADLVFIRFSGFWGWLAKQLVELRYLIFVLGLKRALSMWWRSVKYSASND